MKSAVSRWALGVAVLCAAWPAHGADEPARGADERIVRAKAHFDAGLARVRDGDLASALLEFRAAYAAQPHYSVLYNIGLACSGLGKPMEAVAAFEAYLAEGQAQIVSARRREVEERIAANRARIGRLKVTAPDSNTKVWLDGALLPTSAFQTPIEVAMGEHVLFYSRGDGKLERLTVVAPGAAVIAVDIPAIVAPEMGWLQLECQVRDFQVALSSGLRLATPLAGTVAVRAGRVNVSFSRLGYVPTSESVEVVAGQTARVACRPRIEPDIAPSASGRIRLSVPADARVSVDGSAFAGGPLPVGRHTLRVERPGYAPYETSTAIEAGKTLVLEPTLRRSPEAVARSHAVSGRRRAGWLMAGAGALSLGTGAAVYAWNGHRYSEWSAQSPAMSDTANVNRVASIQRADDVALGMLFLGVGLGLTSAWLLFTGE